MKFLPAVAPLALAVALVLGACATAPSEPPLPDALRGAPNEQLLMSLAAKGVQIYECRARKDGSGTEWAFVAPEAMLADRAGRVVGRHYAGPTWEAGDGSKIVGTVKGRADAPAEGAIPWLLLSTRSTGPAGLLAKVTSVQRVNTVGGVAPPADGCTSASLGRSERVGYTADYRFLETR